jgi:GMP synthase (glutamine-hydrolysing)
VAFENAGTLGSALLDRGFSVETVHAGIADMAARNFLSPDLLIVMGGPIGCYQSAEYPFLLDEIGALAARLAARRPTLGICLGAQLMAAALGARVLPGAQGKDIGWASILPAPGSDQCCILGALFQPSIRVLHWHGDTFDLPSGALHLAASSLYPNQAFALGHHGLALQFHAEIRLAELEPWYIGHAAELAQAQVSVAQLRADGCQYAPALEQAAPALWRACLDFLLQR